MNEGNDIRQSEGMAQVRSDLLGGPAEPKEGQYRCAMCKGIFDFQINEQWSDEKAKEELNREFGDVPLKCCDIICNDCFEKVRPDKHRAEFEAYKAETN